MRGIMFSFSMIERSHGYRYSIIIDITTNIQPKISNSFIIFFAEFTNSRRIKKVLRVIRRVKTSPKRVAISGFAVKSVFSKMNVIKSLI